MIDLHTHSNASDGDLHPAQLVEKAAQVGIKALALTDHDTISGLKEAENAAKTFGICFIPGVELEIESDLNIKGDFHLLALGISRLNAEFLAVLRELEGTRERRNQKMIEKMQASGINVQYEDIMTCAGVKTRDSNPNKIIGRPHFGSFLISRKMVKNQEQAFNRWLGKGRPFYVPKEGLEFTKAVRLIHEAGGAAVLAHPMSLYISWGRLPGVITLLKEKGLDGIEAWHSSARVRACKRLEELGRSLGLIITAGSDFHGSARPERKLGHTAGDRKIGEEFLQGIPVSGTPYLSSTS